MTLEALGNLGDFIGGIGVVVTLVYLALQVRQNTNSVRGAAELKSERMRLEWHNLPAADGQLAEIWEKAFREPEALTRQEVLRFLWFMSGYFHILEGFWFQYQRRLIDEATWLPLQSALRGLLSNPLVLAWWNEENLPLSRGFRAFVDDIRASETDGAWTYTSGEDLHARIRQKAVTP